MPPPENVTSSSPSYVPAVANVPVGKLVVHNPFEPSVIIHVRVLLTVVLPNTLSRSRTVAPVIFIGAQVVLSFASRVFPYAADLLSLIVKASYGRVSPTTRLSVSEYAICYPYFLGVTPTSPCISTPRALPKA